MKIIEISKLAEMFHKTSGIFEAPPEMVNAITKWALGIFSAQVWLISINRIKLAINNLGQKNKDHDDFIKTMIVESNLVINECKKYAKSPASNLTKTGSANFPIKYIFNWKYLTPLQQKYGENFLLENKNWPPSIKVSFVFSLTAKLKELTEEDWDAIWIPDSKEIYLFASTNIGTTNKLHVVIQKIKDEIRHEVQHMGQWALKDIKDLESYPGLPSKDMRANLVDAHGTPIFPSSKNNERVEHAHRDIEFYTNLQDSINSFKFLVKNEKDPIGFAKYWTGQEPNFKSQTNSTPDYFFTSLKSNLPKWRKAVSEFYKAI